MSFSQPSRQRLAPALQLAGFVDILFLLLVFFLTASVFREQERQVPISLYEAETAELSAEAGTQLIVTTSEGGEVFLGPRKVTLAELRSALTDLAERFPDESLVIRSDVESRVGLFAEVTDIARAAGITDVQFATRGGVADGDGGGDAGGGGAAEAASEGPPAPAEP